MAEGDVAKRIQSKRASVQKAQEAHKRGEKERADKIQTTQAAYAANKENPVLLDILEKGRSFVQYHTKMAQDGVGARGTGRLDEKGVEILETVYYSTEKRVGELDRASGILELLDYIERQINPPKKDKVAKPKQAA